MEAIKAINTRRSIRSYKKKSIPKRIVKQLINAGRNAPSAFNDQPWVFITFTDQAKKDSIAKHKSQRSKFIREAPLMIACCYDERKSHSAAHNLENVAVAAENILLAAHALGLGACYIGAFDPNYPGIEKSIIKQLKLPKHVKIVCLISVGYPNEVPGKKRMRPLNEVWKNEFYSTD